MNIVRDQQKTLTWMCSDCIVPKRLINAAKLTAEVYWGIHERKKKQAQTTNAKREDWLTHLRSFQRIYCITHLLYHSMYLSLPFSPPSSAQRGDFVNIFGNFKDNVHWRINQRKSSSMSKIIGIQKLLKFQYNVNDTTKRHYQTVVTAIYWWKNKKVNFYPSITFIL